MDAAAASESYWAVESGRLIVEKSLPPRFVGHVGSIAGQGAQRAMGDPPRGPCQHSGDISPEVALCLNMTACLGDVNVVVDSDIRNTLASDGRHHDFGAKRPGRRAGPPQATAARYRDGHRTDR